MTKHLLLLAAALAVVLPSAAMAQHYGDRGGGGGHGPGPGAGAPHGPPPGGGGFHGGGGPRPDVRGPEGRPQFQQAQRPEGFRGPDHAGWRGDDRRGGWDNRPGGWDRRGGEGPRGDWRGDRGPGWNGGDRGYGHGGGYYRVGGGRPYGFQRYHAPPFYYPHGWGYRRWSAGLILPSIFLSSAYYWDDWDSTGVGAPPPGYHWVRYGPDLLLVSWRSGRIADVVYDAFY